MRCRPGTARRARQRQSAATMEPPKSTERRGLKPVTLAGPSRRPRDETARGTSIDCAFQARALTIPRPPAIPAHNPGIRGKRAMRPPSEALFFLAMSKGRCIRHNGRSDFTRHAGEGRHPGEQELGRAAAMYCRSGPGLQRGGESGSRPGFPSMAAHGGRADRRKEIRPRRGSGDSARRGCHRSRLRHRCNLRTEEARWRPAVALVVA